MAGRLLEAKVMRQVVSNTPACNEYENVVCEKANEVECDAGICQTSAFVCVLPVKNGG